MKFASRPWPHTRVNLPVILKKHKRDDASAVSAITYGGSINPNLNYDHSTGKDIPGQDWWDTEQPMDCFKFASNQIASIHSYDYSQSSDLQEIHWNVITKISRASVTFADSPALILAEFLALTQLESISSDAGELIISGCDLMTILRLPVLSAIGNAGTLDFGDCTTLVTLNLGSLTTIGSSVDLVGAGCTILSSPVIGNFVSGNNSSINFFGCALTATVVNHILARCVASPLFTTGTVDLSGGTNAAPTGQGIIDSATLTGRGCTITTN